jgi:predicted DNA-binding transcriptional regulator
MQVLNCNCDLLDDELIDEGWTCYVCYENKDTKPLQEKGQGQ